jgi:hypothetical protein
MKKEIKPDPQDSTTQDAELTAESIQENPKTAPDIDFDDDYELAQKLSKGNQEVERAEGNKTKDGSETLSS